MMLGKATVSRSTLTFLLSCGLLVIYKVSAKDCDTEDMGAAMLSCQTERESLSDASRLNNTTLLCRALQTYSKCIGPRVGNCHGEALLAFKVIKQQYAASPYNCHIAQSSNDLGDHTRNDLDSHLGNDEDNHIVTQPLTDGFAGVTVSPLPSYTHTVKEEEPTLTSDVTTTTTTTTTPTTANKKGVPTPSVHTTTSSASSSRHACCLVVNAVFAIVFIALLL